MHETKGIHPCCCGHDCGRCVTYLATVGQDEALRQRAQTFYRDTFGLSIPLSELHCMGGRSDDVFYLCKGCPWMKCCSERNVSSCDECADYPCAPLADYMDKYVNRCNQVRDPEETDRAKHK